MILESYTVRTYTETAPASLPVRAWRGAVDTLFLLFGAFAIALGLGVLAAIPVVGLFALGYILEAAARVARSGRLRDGFPGVRRVARLGSCLVGTFIISIPLIIVGSQLEDARLFARGSEVETGLRTSRFLLLVVTSLQVLNAVVRGGHFLSFLNPVGSLLGLHWLVARSWRPSPEGGSRLARLRAFVADLRLPHLFSLGARGFVAAFIWLAPPTALLAAGRDHPLLGLAGGALLIPVLAWLPFLQVRLATEDRFAAAFDVAAIRARRRRAPLLHAVSVFLLLALALPLYLLKVEAIPSDARWLAATAFILAILPAKLLVGRAYASGREGPVARVWLRAACWHVEGPAIALYVLLVFFSQFIDWFGARGLFAHHAFLLPTSY